MIDLPSFQIGSTPLFHACLRGHVKVAKRLLEDPRTCLSLLKVYTHCLKILQKVSFDVASKNGQFWRVFLNLKLVVKQSYQTGSF